MLLLSAPSFSRFVLTVNKIPTLCPENVREKSCKHAFVISTIVYATEGAII